MLIRFLQKTGIFITVLGLGSVTVPSLATTTPVSIHMGIYAPFSSDRAYIGRNILGAMELARDDIKSANERYEFFTLDDIPNPKHAALVLEQFVKANQLQVLITDGTDDGLVVAQVAKKLDLLHINLANKSGIADGRFNFQTLKQAKHQRYADAHEMNSEFIKKFQQQYENYPSVEAGYAYDVFQVLHQSIHASLEHHHSASTRLVAQELLAIKDTKGVMGRIQTDNKGMMLAQFESVNKAVG